MNGHYRRALYGDVQGHFPLSAITKAISRYLLDFDSLVKTNGVLAKPIVFTADFDISLRVIGGVAAGSMLVSGGTTGGGFEIYKTGDGGISIWHNGESKGGNPTVITNGKSNLIRVKRTGTSVEIYLNRVYLVTAVNVTGDCVITHAGCRAGGSFYFNGNLADLEFSGDGVPLTKLSLDKAPPIDLYKYGADLGWKHPEGVGTTVTQTGQYAIVFGDNGGYSKLENGKSYQLDLEITTDKPLLVTMGSNTILNKGISKSGKYTFVFSVPDDGVSYTVCRIYSSSSSHIPVTATLHLATVREITNYDTIQANKNIIYAEGNTFGDNVVVNGDFSDGLNDWIVTDGGQTVEVVGGRLHIITDGTSCGVRQTNGLPDVAVELSFYYEAVSGSLKAQIGSLSFPVTETGHYTYITTAANANIYLYRNSGAGEGYFSNYKVREIEGNAITMKGLYPDQQNKYTLISKGWLGKNTVVNGGFDSDIGFVHSGTSISDGLIKFGVGTTYADQLAILTQDDTYLIGYDLTAYVSGTTGVSSTSFNATYANIVGTHEFIASAKSDRLRLVSTVGGNEMDNVSVKRLIEVA